MFKDFVSSFGKIRTSSYRFLARIYEFIHDSFKFPEIDGEEAFLTTSNMLVCRYLIRKVSILENLRRKNFALMQILTAYKEDDGSFKRKSILKADKRTKTDLENDLENPDLTRLDVEEQIKLLSAESFNAGKKPPKEEINPIEIYAQIEKDRQRVSDIIEQFYEVYGTSLGKSLIDKGICHSDLQTTPSGFASHPSVEGNFRVPDSTINTSTYEVNNHALTGSATDTTLSGKTTPSGFASHPSVEGNLAVPDKSLKTKKKRPFSYEIGILESEPFLIKSLEPDGKPFYEDLIDEIFMQRETYNTLLDVYHHEKYGVKFENKREASMLFMQKLLQNYRDLSFEDLAKKMSDYDVFERPILHPADDFMPDLSTFDPVKITLIMMICGMKIYHKVFDHTRPYEKLIVPKRNRRGMVMPADTGASPKPILETKTDILQGVNEVVYYDVPCSEAVNALLKKMDKSFGSHEMFLEPPAKFYKSPRVVPDFATIPEPLQKHYERLELNIRMGEKMPAYLENLEKKAKEKIPALEAARGELRTAPWRDENGKIPVYTEEELEEALKEK